jgi:hypothetical protein
MQGCLFALTGKALDAVHTINAGIAACQSTGASVLTPLSLSYLAKASAELGQFDEAWRCEATSTIDATKERWFEAETNCIAGEIAQKSLQPDVAKAEVHFERALVVARQQQAKSWELRAAMSLARLWRFNAVLFVCFAVVAPSLSSSALAAFFGVIALAGIGYSCSTLIRTSGRYSSATSFMDWLWYALTPAAGYLILAIAIT